jgi:hypothetical protein
MVMSYSLAPSQKPRNTHPLFLPDSSASQDPSFKSMSAESLVELTTKVVSARATLVAARSTPLPQSMVVTVAHIRSTILLMFCSSFEGT